MSTLEELNRAINRALRALNGIAVSIPLSSIADRKAALEEIAQVLAHVDKLQRLIVVSDPGLEYHFEDGRAPTRVMNEIAGLVQAAERYAQEGKVEAAEDALQRACDMEPPPLAYEMIAKRLNTLRGSK